MHPLFEAMGDAARRAMFAKLKASGGAGLLRIPAVKLQMAQSRLALAAGASNMSPRQGYLQTKYGKDVKHMRPDQTMRVLAKARQVGQAKYAAIPAGGEARKLSGKASGDARWAASALSTKGRDIVTGKPKTTSLSAIAQLSRARAERGDMPGIPKDYLSHGPKGSPAIHRLTDKRLSVRPGGRLPTFPASRIKAIARRGNPDAGVKSRVSGLFRHQ